MTTRGIFILENVRSRQREGDWVPLPSVFGRDSLQQIGYVVGGSDSSDNTVSYYQSITYSNDTRSNVANLPQGRAGVYGLASRINGYAVGGGAGTTGTPGTYYSSSNRLTFSTQTNSALPGVNMGESFGRGGSAGSSTAGYIAGGYSVPGEGTGWSRLEKLTYSTETIARIPSSNLPGVGYGGATGHSQAATGNGDLFGVWIGGNIFPSPSSNLTGTSVFKLSFPVDSWNHSTSWNLTPGNRLQKAGMTSSDTGAYIVGGGYPNHTRVQKISFADMTNSVITNSASPGRTDLTGTGTPGLGYYAGGAEGNNANGTGGSITSIVEKMNFSTESISRIPSLDLANSLSKTGSMSATGDNKDLNPQYRWVDNAPASPNFGYSMTGKVHPSSPSQHQTMQVTYKIDYGTDTSSSLPSGGVSYGYYEAFGGGNSLAAYKMGGLSNDVPADGSEISEKVVYATDLRQGLPNYGNRRYGSFAVTHGETALYGVGGRGQSSNQLQVNVYKMSYSAETWSSVPGSNSHLDTARRDGASMASATHGYFAGGGNVPGNPASPIYRSDVDKMTFASETTDRIPSANLLSNNYSNKGWSDSTSAYSAAGNDSSNYLSRIDKISFATDTTQLFTTGSLPAPMVQPQTMTSDTTAFNAGGNAYPGGYKSSVTKLWFATGTLSASGNLPTYQYSGVGASAGNDNLPFQSAPPETPTPETSAVTTDFGLRGSGGTVIDKLDFTTDTISVGMEMPSTPETGGHDGDAWYDQTGGRAIFGTGGASGPINQIKVGTLTGSRIPSLSPVATVPNTSYGLYKTWNYSATEGWYQGGRSWSPSYPSHNTTATRMTFATDTLSDQSYGRLAAGIERAQGLSNPTHKYSIGGRSNNPSGSDTTYTFKAPFASGDFSQIPSGSLNANTSDHGGTGNTTEGYIAGRLSSPANGASPESRFQKLTYSNDTMSTLPSSTLPNNPPVTSIGQYLEATGTQTTGYFGGGDYMGPLNGNNFPNVKLVYATGTPSTIPAWVTSDTVRNGFQQSSGEQTGNGKSPVDNMMK